MHSHDTHMTHTQITARDSRGVVVTIIADNYFGYCKKETKTQLGYASNLYGLVSSLPPAFTYSQRVS